MQTRFAVVTLHNAETQSRASVLVGFFNGRWAAFRADTGIALSWRESARREARVSPLVGDSTHCGSVNNADKPFVEIAMLLKRHAMLLSRNYYYDDPMDWIVQENKEVTFNELATRFYTGVVSTSAFMNLFTRLLMAGSLSRGDRAARVRQLAINLVARANANHTRAQGRPALMTGYAGLLASNPGIYWRGRVFERAVGVSLYKGHRTTLARLGDTIRKCIGNSRNGANFEGLYNELLDMLRPVETDQWNDLYAAIGPLNTPTRARILEALNCIHNNPIIFGDCNHFFEDGSGMRIGQRGQRTLLHWCPTCVASRSVMVQDLSRPGAQVRWPREHAVAGSDGRFYSYNYDELAAQSERGQAIMSYTTNVTRMLPSDVNITSTHYGDFLMGFELEMTSGRDYDSTSAARDVRKRLGEDYCIVKSDGSLPSNGFEVVTAPRGIEEHVRRVSGWEINPSYRAWDTGSCGLHVHIHSRAFTEMTLGKFIMLFNHHENATFIRKLAGRHPFKDTQAARYCAQEEQTILDNPKAAIKGKGSERYRMINTTNLSSAEAARLGLRGGIGRYDTIEVRIYKASLRKERLLAQLEFTHAAVMFCRVASYRELNGKTFLQWLVPNAKSYPNLSNWFGVRRSKAIKDAGDKPLQDVCTDRVLDPEAVQPAPPPVRRSRTVPTF